METLLALTFLTPVYHAEHNLNTAKAAAEYRIETTYNINIDRNNINCSYLGGRWDCNYTSTVSNNTYNVSCTKFIVEDHTNCFVSKKEGK